jgi:hypothetical protein
VCHAYVSMSMLSRALTTDFYSGMLSIGGKLAKARYYMDNEREEASQERCRPGDGRNEEQKAHARAPERDRDQGSGNAMGKRSEES